MTRQVYVTSVSKFLVNLKKKCGSLDSRFKMKIMHNDKVMQNRIFKFSLSQNTIRKMQKVNMSCSKLTDLGMIDCVFLKIQFPILGILFFLI